MQEMKDEQLYNDEPFFEDLELISKEKSKDKLKESEEENPETNEKISNKKIHF